MKVNEIITELSFQGSKCTKDCSGHNAGYNWAMTRKHTANCKSNSQSFVNGCNIASNQIKTGKVVRPKVRDGRGKFIRPSYKK